MRPCFIVPTANIENLAAVSSDIHLLLAHKIIESSVYAKAYGELSKKGHYIIVDNSAFELGYSMGVVDLVEAARATSAHEIVLPEVYKDKDATLKTVNESIYRVRVLTNPNETYKLGAVIQSDTFNGYINCVEEFLKIDAIDVVYIPLIDPSDSPFAHVRTKTQRIMLNRIFLMNILSQHFTDRDVHLLGLTNPFELEVQRRHKFIRSCDSSSAFIHGYFGFTINEMGLPTEKISEKMNFKNWEAVPDTYKWWRIQRNIDQIKAFCNDN